MEINASPFVSALADAAHPAQKPDAHAQALQVAIANLASGSTTGLVQTETALLRTLLQALQSSPETRGQIGPLLSDLATAQVLPAVPASIRNEIARTLNVASPLRNLPDDGELARILLSPRTTPGAAATAQPASNVAQQPALLSDLKSALASLQGALQQWNPRESLPTATANAAATSPAPQPPAAPIASPLPSAGSQSRPAVPAFPGQATSPAASSGATTDITSVQRMAAGSASTPPAPVVPLGSMATLPLPIVAGNNPAHGGMADAMVSFLLSQQAAATPSDAMMRLRSSRLTNPGDGKSDISPGATNPAVTAYRKALPSTPVQPTTLWPHDPGAAFIARTLSARTEAALTQVKVLEITAQLQRAEQSTANAQVAPEPRWTFDLPLQTPFGQAQARFEVSRDSFRTRKGAQAVVWRARFSMDVEPLGPIHAQIALLGKHAWIGLWAERAESMSLLEQQQITLQNRFSEDNVEAEVICCLGSPPAHAAGTGTMWDNAV